jgi:hypothetical protein
MTARSSLTVVAALLLTAQLGGCAGRKGADNEAGPQSRAEVTIEVENQNFYDARVYLLVLGQRTRLGQVNGNSTETFSFALQPDEVRIEVDFIGGAGGFVTEAMPVSAGDQLELQILPDAHRLRPKR